MFGYASNSSKVIPPLTLQMLKSLIFGQYMGLGRHFAKHSKIAKSVQVNIFRATDSRFVKSSIECGYLVWGMR